MGAVKNSNNFKQIFKITLDLCLVEGYYIYIERKLI
nr:MAG TPA: hypothetical protein [Caudoviricetes sp.]